MTWIGEYGYFGLFIFSLLAATIIPVSSESAVIGAVLNKMDVCYILLWATAGNCLGTLVNYFLGVFIGEKWVKKNPKKSTQRVMYLSNRYGWPVMFLSWLPVIGDPITIAAGIFRWNVFVFGAIVFSLRFLRYYLIVKLII